MRVLVDTNVLLRWSQVSHPQRALCRAAIAALVTQGAELCVTFQNIAEFWNVATRPAERSGFGLTPVEAARDVGVIERLFLLLPDTPATYAEWRAMVVDLQVCGVQVHDARLAAAMVAHNLTSSLSFNKTDFAHYTGISVLDPSDVLSRGKPSHD